MDEWATFRLLVVAGVIGTWVGVMIIMVNVIGMKRHVKALLDYRIAATIDKMKRVDHGQ